jgi:hypothetical protein
MEGTVRRSGERLRVTARLVNGADGYEVLSSVYDRGPEEILTLQREIAFQIAGPRPGDRMLPASYWRRSGLCTGSRQTGGCLHYSVLAERDLAG